MGGGLVGMTLAIGLSMNGLKVAVIDAAPPEAGLDAGFDGRSSAIAYASIKLLEGLGIWPHLGDDPSPIREIRVSDGPSRLFLHFDGQTAGGEPLGQMVENRHMRRALLARAKEVMADGHGLQILAPQRATEYEADASSARITLAEGQTIGSTLLIGAEGRGSPLRDWAEIRLGRWDYGQVGIVATIRHELPHMGIAHERFLPPGPFAILPLNDNCASLVWTASSDNADDIMALSDHAFEAEVRKRVGDFLGKVRVIGPRWSYPLNLQLADRYIDDRVALVGDAAHGIHPIAGQGLNLGLRDVAALIEVVIEAARLGVDIGSPVVLERYQTWRRADNLILATGMDALNRLFSNDIAPIRVARDIGIAAVNKLPPVKRFFMHHARGTVGQLPRLLKGDPV